MNKKKLPVTNIGTTSIITVFVILCMVAFSLLSYMSAQRDAQFNRQLEVQTSAYYAASNEAYRQIAEFDQALWEAYEADLLDTVAPVYQFSVPIDDHRSLEVELTVCDPGEGTASLYQITRFQEVTTDVWEGDETLHLFSFSD